MARKLVDQKAKKEARNKKILIAGGVLFVLLLVFQVPRTLKMLNPPAPKHQSAAATTTPAETTPTSTTPTETVPTAPGTSVSAGRAVLTAQLAPAAREGQLSVLSASFKSKDPFRQLIKDASPESAATPAPAEKLKLKVVPSTPATKAAPAAPTAPAAKKVVLPFLSAMISVNGVKEGVNVTVDFPVATPVFHLVSLTKKTAKISVAGGSLANGAPTLILRRGKPLTLVNTADGTRYRLVLVSTSRDPAKVPATEETGASGATTTTPTTTTTTPTTTTPTIGG
jgi:hypothetical protein